MTLDEAMVIVLTEILMEKQEKPSYMGVDIANRALAMIKGPDKSLRKTEAALKATEKKGSANET